MMTCSPDLREGLAAEQPRHSFCYFVQPAMSAKS